MDKQSILDTKERVPTTPWDVSLNLMAQLSTSPVLSRSAILGQADTIITKDRAATHGEAENSFQTIADYWSVYLSKKFGMKIVITPMDVSQLMVLFKVSRIHNNPQHLDNWLDQVGYSAIAGEIAMNTINTSGQPTKG